jgi:branched-chain amino acid transport system ATP-binding protein
MTNAPQTVLEVQGIHTYYGTIEALKGISLEVREGEIVTLIGANGAGKSTTLRSINGLNHPRTGTINFMGENITHAPAHKIVKRGISQSPEGRKLFSRMTVEENLDMGAFGLLVTQSRDKGIFELFHASGRVHQKAGTLWGGSESARSGARWPVKLLMLDDRRWG